MLQDLPMAKITRAELREGICSRAEADNLEYLLLPRELAFFGVDGGGRRRG